MDEASAAGPVAPMRILALVGDFPVLSKTFVLDQLVGLVQAGHQVTVLASPPETGAHDLVVPDEVGARIRHLPRRPSGRVRQLLATASEGLRRSPATTRRALGRRDLAVGERAEALRLALAIDRLGPFDVVHAHFGPLGRDAVVARDLLDIDLPVVTAFHGYDLSRWLDRSGPDALAPLLTGGERFLPVSDVWRERLLTLGAPAERVHVHHMGIDLGRFRSLERRWDRRPLRLLSVCRLVEKKGITDAVAAVGHLVAAGHDVVYRIIGDGPERARLRAQVEQSGLHHHVELVGALPRDAVIAALAEHDVLMAPSVTAADGDREGIPMVLMEAMATGMPVVATRHSGIPELVEHDRTGLLADERDAAALAAQVARYLAEPDLAVRLGRAGRRRVAAAFDLDVLVVRLAEHLSDVGAGHDRAHTSGGPAVSVVIPTRDRARLLRRALDSVLRQTFTDLEVLVVDDGSTDDTQTLVGRIDDPRVHYLRSEGAGAGAARNAGLRAARGAFVAFLDSDDEWLPTKLEVQIAQLRRLPDHVGLVHCAMAIVDGDGGERTWHPSHRGRVHREFLLRNRIHGISGVVIRRDVIAAVGGFDERLPAVEDYEYWLRVTRTYAIEHEDQVLVRYHDAPDPDRLSRQAVANLAARDAVFARHEADLRAAGVAHRFLLESARRARRRPVQDDRMARRLALRALAIVPWSRSGWTIVVRSLIPRRFRRRHTAMGGHRPAEPLRDDR